MSTIPAGCGQFTMTYSGSGVPTGAANTLGFFNSQPNDALALATQMETLWELNVMPSLVQNTGLDEVICKLGPNVSGPSATVGSGAAGGDLSAQAPSNVAYLVHKVTASGGRRGRGRLFLPGVDETEVDQTGLVSAGKVAQLQAGLDQLYDDMVATDMSPALLHEPETVWILVNGRPRRSPVGVAPAPTLITGFQVATIVATQRRRQRR